MDVWCCKNPFPRQKNLPEGLERCPCREGGGFVCVHSASEFESTPLEKIRIEFAERVGTFDKD